MLCILQNAVICGRSLLENVLFSLYLTIIFFLRFFVLNINFFLWACHLCECDNFCLFVIHFFDFDIFKELKLSACDTKKTRKKIIHLNEYSCLFILSMFKRIKSIHIAQRYNTFICIIHLNAITCSIWKKNGAKPNHE